MSGPASGAGPAPATGMDLAAGAGLPLAGRRVVVTRAADQGGELVGRLESLGASVVEVPTIAIVEPEDGGAALDRAVARHAGAGHGGGVAEYDWVVVTSPNGAGRLAASLARAGLGDLGFARLAAVGAGTAEVLGAHGLPVDLLPPRFVADSLVEVFPAGPGRVLAVQAEAARPVLAEGLRAKGWDVDAVVAYRTVPPELPADLVAQATGCDAITFLSSSAVVNYLNAAGPDAVPPIVVCIGPVTAATASERGLVVSAVAAEHSVGGLVAAVVDACTSAARGSGPA